MKNNYNRSLLAIFLLFLLSCHSLHKEPKDDPLKKPNIVFIYADDLGYGELGAYGQKKIETPNIDSLAKNGMKFTQFYAFPVCAPSRYLLMTGKNSGHAYIRSNDEWSQRGDVWNFKKMEANPALEGELPIPDSTITVANILKESGYKTAIVGKWGLGGPVTGGIPNNQGFDYFFGSLGQRQDHQYYPGHLWKDKHRIPLPNNKVKDPAVKFPDDLNPRDAKNYKKYKQSEYSPDLMLGHAMRFIKSNKEHPFFLYFASPLPHVSLQAPSKWVKYYHEKFGDEKPFLGGNYTPNRYPHATYAAMVSTLDQQVGEIVKELKKLGLYKNTLIMFSSDNGPTFNGGSDSPWFDSGGPFKSEKGWGKAYVHEGGIRVPFIAEWPGKINPGSKSNLISAIWDIVPTLSQVADTTAPKDNNGISILPTLLDNSKKQKKHKYLYWEYPDYGGQQAVRKGKWKGIRMNIMKKGNMKIQLFNLEKDIQEQHNVAKQHPDIVKKIRSIMNKEHTIPLVDVFKMKALGDE